MNTEPTQNNQSSDEIWKPREISDDTIPNLGKKSLSGIVEVGTGPEVQKPVLIDSVPGVVREVEVQSPQGTEQRIVVRDTEFRGDPRRVIGHPANEANQALQAYSDSLKN